MLAAPISKAVKFSLSDAVTKEIKLAICLSISYKRNGRGTEEERKTYFQIDKGKILLYQSL